MFPDTETVVNHLRGVWDEESMREYESLYVVYFGKDDNIVDTRLLNIGSCDSCTVDTRRLIKYALANNAKGVIIAHNHPFGHPDPSAEDFDVVSMLLKALKIFKIYLLDSIILTESDFSSIYRSKSLNVHQQTLK